MATQNIKTRIALKYNTYDYWTGQGSTYTPLKGEVCFCYESTEGGNQRVRFKVGDGSKKFSELEWASALASDVYNWAKQSETDFIAWLEEKYPIPSLPNFTYVDYANAQNLTNDQKKQARQNIGAGTSSFSGSYADLTDKPELPVITNSELTIEKDQWVMTLSSEELEFLNASTGQYAIVSHQGLKIDSSACDGSQYTLYGQRGITYSPQSGASYTYAYPIKSGTIALTEDIGSGTLILRAKGALEATTTVFSANDTSSPTFSVTHVKEGPSDEGFSGTQTETSINKYGDSITIPVPKLDVNEYGHVTGISEIDYSITVPEALDLSNYKTKQEENSGKTLTGAKVLSELTQDENGEVSYDTRSLTPEDIGAQPKGNYKTIQEAVTDPNENGNATSFIATISQDTNGKITATKKSIDLSGYKTKQTAYSKDVENTKRITSITQNANGDISVDTDTLSSNNISDFSTAVAAIKVANAAQADKVANALTINGTTYDGSAAKSITITVPDSPSITIENKTDTDTDDLVYAVTNLVESGALNHTITPTYTPVPTKAYVDKMAAGAVDYLGTLAALTGLSTTAKKGDFYRVTAELKSGSTVLAFVGDLVIAEKDSPAKTIDGTNWTAIHCGDGDISNVAAGNGLTGGGATGSVTLSAKAGNHITVDANGIHHETKPTTGTAQSAIAGSGRTYITEVLVDTYGHVAGVKTATETVTDTHHEAKNIIGASVTAKENAAVAKATNSIYLNLIENDTVRSHHNIVGAGGTKVYSDANGKITIDSTDNNTWRPIAVNGTTKLSDSATTINFSASGAASVAYNNGTITISATDTDTGATEVDTSGSGNAVTSASYDADSRKITLNKGNTFVDLTSAQTISGVKTFSAQQKFTVADGMAPFTVDSSTKVTNLNADKLDGQEGSYYLDYDNFTNIPTIPIVNDGTLTLKASDGITATEKTFTANDADNVTFEVKHAVPTGASATSYGPSAGGEQTAKGTLDIIVPQITTDKFGHITGVSNKTFKVTDTDTIYTHPNSEVTVGTYESVTVNAQGHVTAGTNPTKYWANVAVSGSSNDNTSPTFNPGFKVKVATNNDLNPAADWAWASPIAKYLWHDLLAFRAAKFESSTDGTTWTENITENYKKMVTNQKESQALTIIDDSKPYCRFTWLPSTTSQTWHACQAQWLVIGFTWVPSAATCTIKFQTTADGGTTWTDTCSVSVTGNSTPHWFKLDSSKWSNCYGVRLIFTRTSSAGSTAISSVKWLTPRWGNQGFGSEAEFPYEWNNNQDIYPRVAKASNLGSSSKEWANVYTDNLSVATINGVTVGSSPKFTDTNTAHSHGEGAGILLVDTNTGGTSGTVAYKAALVNETKSGNAASYTAGSSSKFYAVQLDKDGKLAVYVPWDTNTDTHYTTGLYVGATNTKANAATTNGGTYLKLYDDNTRRAEFKITGSGATTVTSDANGNITITSANDNDNTAHSHTQGGGLVITGTGGISGSVDYKLASPSTTYGTDAMYITAMTAAGNTQYRHSNVTLSTTGDINAVTYKIADSATIKYDSQNECVRIMF